jgi:hypothetical protein
MTHLFHAQYTLSYLVWASYETYLINPFLLYLYGVEVVLFLFWSFYRR